MRFRVTDRALVGVLLILLLPAVPAKAATQDSARGPRGDALEALTAEVAADLRCPVCRQLSIQDSPSELALEMKGVIRDRLAAGQSPEEVKAYFVSKYGEWILLAPPRRGFSLLVWLLPVVGIVGGGLVIARVLRGWLRAGQGDTAPEEGLAQR